MFPSCPSDKSCISSDNCSSGRNTASRIPIGITSFGDENQQIRIQSAVYKYNNSANNSVNSKCVVISPVRNSFLKNSFKAKNYERDAEGMSKNEKKSCNQYEGVGAFPTIHLKKSAVRYRPIRKFNDVKIPYPELPVNRFLSPEICPELKSNTRSVLDVLEDLSGKKIHIKENNGNNKPKSKGLGGDYVLNSNTVYKPLFVQQPKISSVLTRDNTTQTLSSLCTESSSSQSSNSLIKNDISDPRTELRRKLAKQNNEIFASLSSSIVSPFALKRKIEKVLSDVEDENFTNESATKKSKISEPPKNYNKNGVSKSLGCSKTNSTSSMKLNNKKKRKEANSPASPNKDRLTTIFLDMQSGNRESQIFRSIPLPTETKSVKDLQTPIINGLENKRANSVVHSSQGTDTIEMGKDESAPKNSPNLGLTEKVVLMDSKNSENGQPNNPSMFDFHINKTETIPNDNLKSTSATLQLDVNATSTTKFNFPKTSEIIQFKNASHLNGGLQNISNESNLEKNNSDNQFLKKSLTSESYNDKSNFNSFKLGAGTFSSSEVGESGKNAKVVTSETVSESAPVSSNSIVQFSFGTTTNDTTFGTQTSMVKFGTANIQNSSTSCTKALFSFKDNTLSNQKSHEISKIEEKDNTLNSEPSSIVVTTESMPPGAFNFTQKSSMDSPPKTVGNTASPTTKSNDISLSSSATNLTTNTTAAVESNKCEFTFRHEVGPHTISTKRVNDSEEQKVSFSFGQKSDIDQNKTQELCEQKNANLFSFGQKPTVQESTPNISSQSQNLPVSTQQSPIFGHNVPATTTAPVTFGKSSNPQISDGFEAKSKAECLTNISASTFSKNNTAFPTNTPLFGPSANKFGNATTQAPIGLEKSTSNASGFGFGVSTTTQPTATLGVSSASQPSPSFGASVTSQSKSEFGSSSTTQSTPVFEASPSDSTFRVSASTQSSSNFGVSTAQSRPSFGEKSTPQSICTFGISSASQPTSSFNVTTTTQPAPVFGNTTSHSFGVSSTQSTHTFGTTTGFKVSSSQTNSIFGVPTSSPSTVKFGPITTQTNSSFGTSPSFSTSSSTQPNTSFGVPVVTSTSIFGTTQPSFSQTFGNKPVSSHGQTANIFEQTTAPSFSSSNAFNSNQNNVFVPKPTAEGRMFDQSKTQTSTFGSAAQPFATQSKFSFGMPTSNITGFTTSPVNTTTTAPAFSFGGSATQNTFTFNSSTSGSNNSFAFKSPASEPFKFGTTAAAAAAAAAATTTITTTTKEGSGFGGTNTATFTFGSGQMNNNSTTESKPTFNFGSTQVSSSAPFNFGTAPSPVFSFGGSTGSGSSFNFGAPTPTPSIPFGHTSTSSPSVPFAVPGTFCIGSGSSQSRPRATSRPRRRP